MICTYRYGTIAHDRVKTRDMYSQNGNISRLISFQLKYILILGMAFLIISVVNAAA